MSGPPISFLMPMYNGLEFTRAALRTLAGTVDLSPHEVILINDASTDGTAEFLRQLPPPFRALHNFRRSGYAASMNRGVAEARHETLCLLNNDLEFTANWLPPLLTALANLPDAGVVGNVQISLRTKKYDHLGVIFGENGAPIHFGKFFSFNPFHGVTEWKAVTAACWVVQKNVFLAAGGFDEGFLNGCEDVDLCLKLGRLGRRHYVANESVIYHHVSASEGRRDFNPQNEARLLNRWREHVQASLTPQDRRRFAINYLLRFVLRPWRCNGYKLWRSLLTLLKFGH